MNKKTIEALTTGAGKGKQRGGINSTDVWITPDALYRQLSDLYGPFDLDAAADEENTKCELFISEEHNALEMDWSGNVWCNPPYSKLDDFIEKAESEIESGRVECITFLLPLRATKGWFRKLWQCRYVRHFDVVIGRVPFLRPGQETAKKNSGTPFDSCVFHLTKKRRFGSPEHNIIIQEK